MSRLALHLGQFQTQQHRKVTRRFRRPARLHRAACDESVQGIAARDFRFRGGRLRCHHFRVDGNYIALRRLPLLRGLLIEEVDIRVPRRGDDQVSRIDDLLHLLLIRHQAHRLLRALAIPFPHTGLCRLFLSGRAARRELRSPVDLRVVSRVVVFYDDCFHASCIGDFV